MFKPSARAGAAIDLERVREVVSTSGASKPDAVLDERTGGVHVTFASVGDAEPVIARLREELGGQWTFAGEASYGITEPAGGYDIASRRSALALGAVALLLAVCVLAGFVPYDFDETLVSRLIGAAILVAPLAVAAYLVAGRLRDRDLPSRAAP